MDNSNKSCDRVKTTKIQLISDLHLCKKRKFVEIEPKAKYLLICGDTEMYLTGFKYLEGFMMDVSKKFEKVFWIMGNHECISVSIISLQKIIAKCKKIAKRTGTIFLNNSMAELNQDYMVIGTPLYSKIPDKFKAVTGKLPYSKFLWTRPSGPCSVPRKVNIKLFNKLHEEAKRSIVDLFAKCKESGKKAIVMTHYGPLFPSCVEDVRYRSMTDNVSLTSVYNTDNDMKTVMEAGKGVIALWCFGHDHENLKFKYKGFGYKFDVISNQMGTCEQSWVAKNFRVDYVYTL